jgi:hypothetical protein
MTRRLQGTVPEKQMIFRLVPIFDGSTEAACEVGKVGCALASTAGGVTAIGAMVIVARIPKCSACGVGTFAMKMGHSAL